MSDKATSQTNAQIPTVSPLSRGGILQRSCQTCGQHKPAGDECSECKKKRSPLQRKAVNSEGLEEVPSIVGEVLRSPGQPLDPQTRSLMEPRFGYDFSQVRVHTDPKAARSARSVNALAYTVNQHVVFEAGQFNPTSVRGQELLAHELVHTLQQRSQSDLFPPREISSPEDSSEREADHAVNAAMAGRFTGAVTPLSTGIYRQTEPVSQSQVRDEPAGSSLIVEDAAGMVEPGRMKKTEFLGELRAAVCRTAEEALAGTGQTTEGCPYLEYWFGYYNNQASQHIERAIRRYAPEAARSTSARGYIPIITERVRRAVTVWASTGEVTGVPEDLTAAGAGGASAASAGSGGGRVLFKGREGGAREVSSSQTIQAQLGEGQPLNSSVQSRMESVFGTSFSDVRAHTDGNAAQLSSHFNARAFTVGEHIAFGQGEYQPGTPVGDALIAHELAHTVQQRGSNEAIAPLSLENTGSNDLEEDADRSALGAVVALWSKGWAKLSQIGREAIPRLKSGLRLQACRTVKRCPSGRSWQVRGEPAGLGSLGCVCVWQCLPGGTTSAGTSSGPAFECYPPGSCPQPRVETVDEDYQLREAGQVQNPDETVTGWGGHMTPLGGQAACGCLPLDIEGNQQAHAPLLPVNFDITNLAPTAGRSPRTGTYQPGGTTTSPAGPRRPVAAEVRPASPPAGGSRPGSTPTLPRQLPPGPPPPRQLPPGPPAPRQLPPGPPAPRQLPSGPPAPRQLPSGPPAPRQLPPGPNPTRPPVEPTPAGTTPARPTTASPVAGGSRTIPPRDLSRAQDAVRRTVADAGAGTVRRAGNYHGRLPQNLEQQILSNPDQVYVSTGGSRRLTFRKGSDIVITEGAGSSRGRIVTSYGPSGPRGQSGAAIFGGSPDDPGHPVTDAMITGGTIPTPSGGHEPPAIPIGTTPTPPTNP